MCAAFFSVSGAEFTPDDFLATSKFSQDAESWHPAPPKLNSGGFQILLSNSKCLADQVSATIRFLRNNLPEITRLHEVPSVTDVDVRIAYFWMPGVAALTHTLPNDLHLMLAHARATLTFCVYPCSAPQDEKGHEATEPAR
jgi:hypothetical protein